MENLMLYIAAATLTLALALGPAPAQGGALELATPTPTPVPAPAPAPDYVNLTHLLSVAGPFHTFLSLLESTNVIDTFQNQANNTEQGITIFVPKDSAFSSLKNPSLKNLTEDQRKSLCLFHSLPQYYSLADFSDLSQHNPVISNAGGDYSIDFTYNSGTVRMNTRWTSTKISSSVWSTHPVALYEVSKVLLPVAIFGTDIPPTTAPAPAPESDPPVADSPSEDSKSTKSGSSSAKSSNSSAPFHRSSSITMVWSLLISGLLGGVMFFS